VDRAPEDFWFDLLLSQPPMENTRSCTFGDYFYIAMLKDIGMKKDRARRCSICYLVVRVPTNKL
jgi:hypothetical protein